MKKAFNIRFSTFFTPTCKNPSDSVPLSTVIKMWNRYLSVTDKGTLGKKKLRVVLTGILRILFFFFKVWLCHLLLLKYIFHNLKTIEQFPVVLFIRLYRVVLTFESADEISDCTIHVKATEQNIFHHYFLLRVYSCFMLTLFQYYTPAFKPWQWRKWIFSLHHHY